MARPKRRTSAQLDREIAQFLLRPARKRAAKKSKATRPRRYHESKATGPLATKPKRWNGKKVAEDHDVELHAAKAIYDAVKIATEQGLYAGHLADLVEHMVGRRLYRNEYEVLRLVKAHLGYDQPSGYGGPEPKGKAKLPDRRITERNNYDADQLRADADRAIKAAESEQSYNTQRTMLDRAADDLDVAADKYEQSGHRVLSGTLRKRAQLARAGAMKSLSIYHARKKRT